MEQEHGKRQSDSAARGTGWIYRPDARCNRRPLRNHKAQQATIAASSKTHLGTDSSTVASTRSNARPSAPAYLRHEPPLATAGPFSKQNALAPSLSYRWPSAFSGTASRVPFTANAADVRGVRQSSFSLCRALKPICSWTNEGGAARTEERGQFMDFARSSRPDRDRQPLVHVERAIDIGFSGKLTLENAARIVGRSWRGERRCARRQFGDRRFWGSVVQAGYLGPSITRFNPTMPPCPAQRDRPATTICSRTFEPLEELCLSWRPLGGVQLFAE